MKITLIAFLAVLILVALSGLAEGLDHTYVSNNSSQTIVASTDYDNGQGISHFHNRVIPPGTYQGDQYLGMRDQVRLEIWVLDGCCHNVLELVSDVSVVAVDSHDPTAAQNSGVDIFQAIHGYLFRSEGPVWTTIYPGTGLCNPTNWSCCSIGGDPCSF